MRSRGRNDKISRSLTREKQKPCLALPRTIRFCSRTKLAGALLLAYHIDIDVERETLNGNFQS